MRKNVNHHESCGILLSTINSKSCFEPVKFRDSQDKALCLQPPPVSLPWQPASLLGLGRLVVCLSLVSQLLRGGSTSRKPLRLGKVQPLLSPQSVGAPQVVSLLLGSVGLPATLPSSFRPERPLHGHSVKLSADARGAGGRRTASRQEHARPDEQPVPRLSSWLATGLLESGLPWSQLHLPGPLSRSAQSRPEACLSRQTCRSRLHRAASASRPEHRHCRLTGVFFTPLLSAESFLCWERVPRGCSVPTSGGGGPGPPSKCTWTPRCRFDM